MKEHQSRSDKKDLILVTAQRLFGIYGLEKVSMQEIAEELNLSKASLYYYFPDKESLYRAVIEKEQDEFLSNISGRVEIIDKPSEFLVEYALIRLSFFRTLLNLSRLRSEYFFSLKPSLREVFSNFREKEKVIISDILESGIKEGVFSRLDSNEVAGLYLDLLRGLRIATVNSKANMYLEQEEYDNLLRRTVEFAEIFIRGLQMR